MTPDPEPIVTITVKRLCVILLKAAPRGLRQAECGYALFLSKTKDEHGYYSGPRSPQGAALAASKHTAQGRKAGLMTRFMDYEFKLTEKGKVWAATWDSDPITKLAMTATRITRSVV